MKTSAGVDTKKKAAKTSNDLTGNWSRIGQLVDCLLKSSKEAEKFKTNHHSQTEKFELKQILYARVALSQFLIDEKRTVGKKMAQFAES